MDWKIYYKIIIVIIIKQEEILFEVHLKLAFRMNKLRNGRTRFISSAHNARRSTSYNRSLPTANKFTTASSKPPSEVLYQSQKTKIERYLNEIK